jgi:hypothetical protein
VEGVSDEADGVGGIRQQIMDIRALLHLPLKRKTTIAEEIKRVLLALVDLTAQNQNGVSTTYLAEHSGIERQRLQTIIGSLKQAEYISVVSHGRVQLATPTIEGYEKAAEWRKEIREQAWFRRIPTPLKVVAASLFAAMLGLLWWRVGLSPQTTNLQPLGTKVPFKVYDMGAHPATSIRPDAWFRFSSAPGISQVVPVSSGIYSSGFSEEMGALLGENVPVTLDGIVQFQFDVEMVATRYTVIIDSILFKIESDPVKDPENVIHFPHGEAGWGTWQYELDLASQPAISSINGAKLYKAAIISKDSTVKGISLKPGERESIAVTVDLGKPGNYTLVPIVSYRFRGEAASAEGAPYKVLYPQRYRVWSFWPTSGRVPPWPAVGRVRSTYWEAQYTNSWGIATLDIVADTQTDRMHVPGIPRQLNSNCPTGTHWIAFECSMITFGDYNRLFLIDTRARELRMIIHQDEQLYSRYLEWTDGGELIVGEPVLQNRIDVTLDMTAIDLVMGSSRVLTSTPPTPEPISDDPWQGADLDDGEGYIIVGQYDDTNADGQVDYQDARQVYLEQNSSRLRLAPSGEGQSYPSVSADGTSLVFVQGQISQGFWGPCGASNGQSIFVVGLDGNGLRQVVDAYGWYRNPVWSPNGRFLAFEAARLADNGGELVCDESIYHIYVVDLETGEERQLTYGLLSDHRPQWSADGQWIIAGGDRLSLSRWDGSCTEELFVPPVGWISNVLMEP